MINYTEHLTVIVTFLLLLSSLTYSVLKVDEDSKILQFLRGWTFAGAEIVLVNQFRRLRLKYLFVFMAFVVRCGFIALFEHEAFVEDVMMHNFVTDLFVVYIYYHCEAQERVIFKGYYEYREEFVKFKSLIEKYLPQSVIILDPQTSYPLFANETFAKIFTKKFAFRNLHVKDKLNTRPINTLAVDTLDLLLTQNDSIRYSCKYEPDLSRLGNGITLRHFFLELTTNNFFNMNAVTVTCSYQNSRGKRSLFEVVLMPLSWDREDAVAIILNDITFQDKIIAFKQADKNKDLIIATVSHELRTPLNGIIGLLQIMETKTEQPEVLKDVFLCKDNATLLWNLVNSILDLQMFYSGKLRLKLTKIDLHQFLKDTTKLFQFIASQKGLYLNLKIGSNVEKEITTDENRLRQIIINLIGNAIKFTFHGGVDICIEKDPEEYIKISVSDTGIGIKEDQKKKLFKVYGKFEETQDVSRNGAGLGLTICNTLANALLQTKGEEQIHFESQDGIGSKFWFKIPKEIRSSRDSDINLIDLSDQASSNERKIYSSRLTSLDSGSSFGEILEDYDERIEPNNLRTKVRSHTLKKKRDFNGIEESPNFKDFPMTYEDIPLHISKKFEEISFCQSSEKDLLLFSKNKLHSIPEKTIRHKGLVLIVDDNPFNLMVAQNFLVALGYEVETATSGKEALEKVKELSEKNKLPRFILMDIQMPVMDGYETTRRLKKMVERREIKDVPIIALSANDQDEDVKKSLRSGMVDHLSKPLLKGKLEACLAKLGRNQG